MRLLRLSFVIPLLLLGGCGYKLGEIRPTPMRSIRTLAVPTFKNETYEPRVEVLLADTLIKQLQSDGTYTILSDDRADAILSCTLNRIERKALRSVLSNVLATSEFGITLEVTFIVEDRVTGVVLMEGKATGKTSFFTNDDLQTDETQAISVAARDLAINLTTELSEGW